MTKLQFTALALCSLTLFTECAKQNPTTGFAVANQMRNALREILDSNRKTAKHLETVKDASSFAKALDELTANKIKFRDFRAKYGPATARFENTKEAEGMVKLASDVGECFGANQLAAEDALPKFLSHDPSVKTAWDSYLKASRSAGLD